MKKAVSYVQVFGFRLWSQKNLAERLRQEVVTNSIRKQKDLGSRGPDHRAKSHIISVHIK